MKSKRIAISIQIILSIVKNNAFLILVEVEVCNYMYFSLHHILLLMGSQQYYLLYFSF